MKNHSLQQSVVWTPRRTDLISKEVPWEGIFGVIGCTLLISVCAQVRIPLPNTIVPMTLQSMAVLLVGFALTPTRAVMATMLYVFCGVAGLGVFSQGSLGLVGPTGGYLVGFVVAAWLVSMMKGQERPGVFRLFVAGVVGTMTIFTIGVVWLLPWCGGNINVALSSGVLPFIPKAIVQLIFAVTMVVSVRGLFTNHETLK